MEGSLALNAVIIQAKTWLALYGLKIVGALVILVAGTIVAKWLARLTVKIMERAGMDQTLISFGGNLLRFLLISFVVIAALNQLGFQTTSLIAILGAMALALGMALQSNISNLAAGVMILIFRPFKLGDVIDVAGTVATVKDINMLTTRLLTADGRVVIVPNSKVFGGTITNFSQSELRRVDMVVGIGYEDDIPRAKEVLRQIAAEHPKVLQDKEPQIFVKELADSSVNLGFRVWVMPDDYWNTLWEMNETVKLTLDKEGINIPYPQQDVHLHQAASGD